MQHGESEHVFDTNHRLTVWAVAAIFCLLSLIAHLNAPSSFRESETDWQARLEYHQTEPVFAARPFTNGTVSFMHNQLGLPVRESFFVVNFLLLLLIGPVLYRYLALVGFSHRYAIGGMAIFYLSLPISMAHFAPVWTWSDFWMYLFVSGAFALTLRERLALAALLLAAATLARETTVLILPFWAMLAVETQVASWKRMIGYATVSVAVALLVRTFFINVPLHDPGWEFGQRAGLLAHNFDGFMRTRDSLFSIFTAFGALWFVAPYQAILGRSDSLRGARAMRQGTLWLLPVFLVMTVVSMHARETRLFFPPFVFVIPMALAFMREREESIRRLLSARPGWANLLLGLALIVVGVLIATLLFPTFEYRHWQDGNRALFGLDLAALAVFVIILRRK